MLTAKHDGDVMVWGSIFEKAVVSVYDTKGIINNETYLNADHLGEL